ncbi:Hemolysin_III family protein [Hexamita inflata]|uniref:Hemolysin III family protein n=1 Tax=Hexamita inflata TaxID=28002 RepID=A0AA86RL87_9EUKA|nr:Hemolysin III family protein [Hexamita inflata]
MKVDKLIQCDNLEQSLSDSDTSQEEDDQVIDNGFASKNDPNFSLMTRQQLSEWVRNRNYAKNAVTNEEFNTWSHAVGGLLQILGVLDLVKHSDTLIKKVSFIFYGISMCIMLFGSAIHHGIGLKLGYSVTLYRWLRLLDHAGIFFAISGTVTPFALVAVGGALGFSITVYIHFVLLCGICMKMVLRHTVSQQIFNAIYVFMGFSCLLMGQQMYKALGSGPLWYIGLGGVFYIGGMVIFSIEKPNPFRGVFCSHEIWHIFVLLGAFSHYLAHKLYTVKYHE